MANCTNTAAAPLAAVSDAVADKMAPHITSVMVVINTTRRPSLSASVPNTSCPSTAPTIAAVATPEACEAVSPYCALSTSSTRFMTNRSYASEAKPAEAMSVCKCEGSRRNGGPYTHVSGGMHSMLRGNEVLHTALVI